MALPTVGFVGAGRIARVFVEGWQRAAVDLPAVVAADIDPAALERLPTFDGWLDAVVGDVAKAARQDIVFIAVHPPVIPQVLPGLRGSLSAAAIVVSLAPKFTIAQLAALLGGFDRIARAIPNVPSLIGEGYNPVAYGAALNEQDRAALTDLFAPLGAFPEVAEDVLEAYAIVSAMGPTYFWPQWDELIHLAESFGLTNAAATEAVAEMAAGAAHALTRSKLTASELLGLIPVQPLSEAEASLREAYRTKLPGLWEKIRPATT